IRTAITIASEQGARLVGLAIVDEPDIRAGTPTGFGGSSFKHERDEALVAEARERAADCLALFERRCREAAVPARSLEVVGRPAVSILHEMEARDLTVMGRDANFRFEIENDDTATREEILHRATRPLLLVPEGADGPLGKEVVVAYDGSRAAKRAIAGGRRRDPQPRLGADQHRGAVRLREGDRRRPDGDGRVRALAARAPVSSFGDAWAGRAHHRPALPPALAAP
ncbi:MAG: universal stress protein, partial [Acidobacteria bacterium]|nr:universal stress protein [Acidobacteriota bacterium]